MDDMFMQYNVSQKLDRKKPIKPFVSFSWKFKIISYSTLSTIKFNVLFNVAIQLLLVFPGVSFTA